MKKLSQKEILILLLCLLIGFALRFYRFDQKSLWLDEVHTFNDSRDDLKEQFKFYKEHPGFLHPPLFFVLTHQFYPFPKPERDLRVIPLIFGTLSILMIYLLARQFSSRIALLCTLSLTFMTYHISLSQDGRSYSFLMFIGMTGLYFLMKYLQTSKKKFIFLVALCFSILFHTSYSSIPFIALSQVLWFYRPSQEAKKPTFSGFWTLNGFILLLCLPWIIFLISNYKGQGLMGLASHSENPGSFWYILSGLLHDWVSHVPLMIVSAFLLILLPIFSQYKKNALILLGVFVLPVGGLYAFCKFFHVTHFVTSRYFVNFLPLFLITLYLSLDAIEVRFEWLKKFLRLRFLFIILFIASNLIILPLYYRSEKQDFRGLVNYLKANLQEGDKIFVDGDGYVPPILHYFRISPELRHYVIAYLKESKKIVGFERTFLYRNKNFTIYHDKTCCAQYVADGSRLWIIVTKARAKIILKNSPCVLKGYFDGSFLNLHRFPVDASMYLFLWDPSSPGSKIDDIRFNEDFSF